MPEISRPSRNFTIISVTYLLLLSFGLFTRPHSGFSATKEQVLGYVYAYIPIWIIIAVTVFTATNLAHKDWYKIIFSRRNFVFAIVILDLTGFAFNFDYRGMNGCFPIDEPMFSTTKFVFTIGSILCLTFGFLYTDRKVGRILLIIEFFIWTYKVTHYDESLDLPFPGCYTVVCWTLRVALIAKTLNNTRGMLREPRTRTAGART